MLRVLCSNLKQTLNLICESFLSLLSTIRISVPWEERLKMLQITPQTLIENHQNVYNKECRELRSEY